MRRMTVAALTLLVLLTLSAALAEKTERQVFTSGDYKYTVLEDGTAEIVHYSGKEIELVIPDELDGHVVTAIGDKAFSECSSLASITIPDSVSKIGINPFSPLLGNSSLSVIKISPEHKYFSVIDQVLFEKAEKKPICYPAGLEKSEYAIPKGIRVIGDNAFYFCKNLTTITIPDSVTSIGDSAFLSCISLNSISIPDSVSLVGSNPFEGCSSLSVIKVSPENKHLAAIDQVLFEKAEKKLICYPAGLDKSEYTIPKGIRVIGDSAFSGCNSLASITIPDSVTSIGYSAFFGCRGLNSISLPDSVTSIGNYAFNGCNSLYSITIPDSVTSIGNHALARCSSLSSITIPESVTSMGDYVFYGCRSLSSITIPDSVTFIGDSAFSWCSSLSSITIPGRVPSIGDSAFNSCSSLSSINIPDSVTSVGKYAFVRCTSLNTITIPDSVTSIGDNAFYGCDNLTLTVPRNSYAAQYCKDNNLSYTYPDSLDWLND